ncbi:MAG: 4-hydroxythreonine-4-phosphate dehydrogenase PdxA, partial [Lutibacter sp.]|nr:4-hydroxythreonine-4-phosphate dehydrogenase PdxA [Lutibacter sp.]
NGIKQVDTALENKLNILNLWQEEVEINPGTPTKTSGEYAFKSLEAATDALVEGSIDVLVTAPIDKDNIQSEAFTFPGHTEYLNARIEGTALMILMANRLRIGLVTGHIPLAEVASTITPELIREKVAVMYHTLQQDFGIEKPKIALLGLNPHCGDKGLIGSEDDDIIRPTVQEIQESGQLVYGPYAADSFFGSENYLNFDAVLAMYHDQGLAPFKTLSFGEGVNFTAGLNKIRTSPDHGTAYAMAGKGTAAFDSFKEAVFTAVSLFRERASHKTLTQNPLKTNKGRKNQQNLRRKL